MENDPPVVANRWVPWVRWILLMAMVWGLAYFAQFMLRENQMLSLAVALLTVIPLALFKPLKQRFEIAIEGYPVQIYLDQNILGRVRMKWSTNTSSGHTILGKTDISAWFDTHIRVAGAERKLLVWVKPYPLGFLLGRGSQDFAFHLQRQEWCF